MANKDVVTLVAVADVDTEGEDADSHFDLVRSILQAGDVTFGQLEIPLANDGERQLHAGGKGAGAGGGANSGPLKDPRKGARVLANAGFNVMSFAGNHIMDRGVKPMLDTLAAVAAETDIRLLGAGPTISDARAPAIFDVRGTRIGFLAYCSVLLQGSWALEGRDRSGEVVHRPGLAPLRAHTYYEEVDYQPGNRPNIVTQTDPDDLRAMLADIEKLRKEVDVLVVSQHWGVHFDPDRGTIATYQVEAGHAAIDAGADLILGHHPHVIKGIEFYKGKPILYAMPNFNHRVFDEYGEFVRPGQVHDAQKSYIVKIDIVNKKIDRVALIPCYVENERRQPEPLPRSDPRSEETLRLLEWTCEHNTPRFWTGTGVKRPFPPFETHFAFDGDEIVVTG